MFFGRLDRYIGRSILNTIIMTLFMLVSLSGIIKFIEQLRKVGEGNYSVFAAAIYTLLSVPNDIMIFFPMAALIGGILGLGALATRNELVVVQASGFSHMQIVLSVMKTAIILFLLSSIIGEWLAPLADQTASHYRTKMIYGGSVISTQSGIWAKDKSDFIYINQVINHHELSGVHIYHFDAHDRLISIRYAATAIFEKGAWQLSQIDESNLSDTKKIQGSQTLSEKWETSLTPYKLGIVAMDPDSLSIMGLYDYVKYLKQVGQDSDRYELKMWQKIFSPFSITVMILLSLSFIFGPLRSAATGLRIVTGICFGFVFYLLDKIFGPLSLLYQFSPILGAALPSVLFFSISLYLLLKPNITLFHFNPQK